VLNLPPARPEELQMHALHHDNRGGEPDVHHDVQWPPVDRSAGTLISTNPSWQMSSQIGYMAIGRLRGWEPLVAQGFRLVSTAFVP
jgi:hypothetical protein